jgi:fused signal recognition particle receptor
MFNWFRRQKVKPEQPQATPAPVEENSVVETPTTSEETSQEDYLNWAKKAFKNIQDKKAPVESVSPETTSAPITETEPSSEPESVKEEETVDNTPAWLKKSDRLEILKETAIETPTEIEPDEDFIWSAKVLASQGRQAEDVSEEEITWLKKLRQGLGKTRRSLVNQLKAVVGQGPLNQDAVEEIEALLLQADVGVDATDHIITTLQNKLKQEALPPEKAIKYLKGILREILDAPLANYSNPGFEPEKGKFNIWMLTGVNGVGKTTTVGKLAHLAKQSGYSCIIAAADTFRAAAVEQVKVWGERSQVEVIANPGKNTDPAAVVYDGIEAARSRGIELLLVDTAGRLQNKKNLMEELSKIRRIIDKKADSAVVESLLVLDATLGQNGLRQAEVFSEAAQLSGVILTKIDGTAKGGVALAVARQLNLPIRFVGAGEGIEDLRPFSSYEFVEALLSGE